jgi:hypothetical protein
MHSASSTRREIIDPTRTPATYADIEAIDEDLAKALKAFCGGLWSDTLKLDAMEACVGTINDHYHAFMQQNGEGKCPYCGLSDIKGQHHSKREAYDHYLPKGTYPFNSVNFRNLAPMCHECNSGYKLERAPARHLDPVSRKGTGQRRKAFYSYASSAPGVSVSLTLKTTDIDALQPADIDLHVAAPGRDEEVGAWVDVFGIEERYKAMFCARNVGKYWLVQALDECANEGKTASDIVGKIERNAENCPWAECNFLKKPFLQACRDIGLIRPSAPPSSSPAVATAASPIPSNPNGTAAP